MRNRAKKRSAILVSIRAVPRLADVLPTVIDVHCLKTTGNVRAVVNSNVMTLHATCCMQQK